MDALLRVQPDVLSVPIARRFVVAALTNDGAIPETDVVVLLTSEVVTNAVVHGGPHPLGAEVVVRVSRPARVVRVEVEDHNHEFPQVKGVDLTPKGGRGMVLVDGLAQTWGVTPTSGGKIVWFEVAA